MPSDSDVSQTPAQRLTLFDSICIIVGIIIGVGIFEVTPIVAQNVDGPVMLMSVWVIGGLLALAGALCFAELTTAYPHQGGDYVFLTKAYGRRMGFLFVWAQFWIIRPGNIGAMAFVFANYASRLVGIESGALGKTVLAASAVIVLTVVNVLGVQSGKWTQNVLTVVKVAGLLVIFAVAFLWVRPIEQSPPDDASSQLNFGKAMLFVLFAYGGWNDISFVAAEVKNPRQNLFRALLFGTLVVVVVYLLVNAAFLFGLGHKGVSNSQAVAADLMNSRLGVWGGRAISILICCSALGAINGMTLTGARIFYALGTQHPLFQVLGRWNPRFGAPIRALTGQGLVCLALIVALASRDGFNRMVIFSAPLFWLFLLLVAIGLIVLRYKDPDVERVYRVPFFPFTPILFALMTIFMIYSGVVYAMQEIHLEWICAMVLMAVGVALAFVLPFPPAELASAAKAPPPK